MYLVVSYMRAGAAVFGLVAWFAVLSVPRASAKQPFYYPTAVGDTYVVRGTGHQKGGKETTAEMTGRVASVTEGPDGVEVTTEFVGGTFTEPTTTVRLTDQGIFLLRKGDTAYDPPLRVLPSPLKPDTSWEIPKSDSFPAPIKYTVGKEEEIDVPAGKFRAIRIEGEAECDGVTVRRSEWYAPGVGPVKITTTGSNGTEVVLELKSFTHGKK
jgi:hypothetical protein